MESSTQSPFQKLNFGNSSPKTRKRRYQTFLKLSSFTGFLYFVPNILSTIVFSFLRKGFVIFRSTKTSQSSRLVLDICFLFLIFSREFFLNVLFALTSFFFQRNMFVNTVEISASGLSLWFEKYFLIEQLFSLGKRLWNGFLKKKVLIHKKSLKLVATTLLSKKLIYSLVSLIWRELLQAVSHF